MLDDNKAWVAVMTYPQAEALVAERFRTAEPPIECYLPLLTNKDRRYRRNPSPDKPMFPCYLFARINARQIYQTRTTRGVVRIVSVDHSICVVPQADIDTVRAFEAAQRKVHIMETAKLVRGANAVITHGEFAGMHGTLIKGCKDGNFSVSISVMNVSFVVRIHRNELRPATDEDLAREQSRDIWY